MGSSSGVSSGSLKRKPLTRGRRRDDLFSLGIVARRAVSQFSNLKQNRSTSSSRRIGLNLPINKYASRRTSFFKSMRPQKAPSQKAGIRCYNALWDKSQCLFRKGDIISVTDENDNLPYFAQIRALLSDQFGDRFAALTWLVPTTSAIEPHQFDPEHFVHAVSDPMLYPLEVCTFVQHAPLIPRYCRKWHPRTETEKNLLDELNERNQSINTLHTNLIAFDEKV